MNNLPILQELFESDSMIFMIVGIVIAIIVGLMMKSNKKAGVGAVICFVIYVICEVLSNFSTNYLLAIITLFGGTVALGGCLGFLISLAVNSLRKNKN